MAKKLNTKRSNSRRSPVPASVNRFWLAGLGAVSMAKARGAQAFDILVREGELLDARAKKSVRGTIGELREAVDSRVNDTRQELGSRWNRVEQVFEGRVSQVVDRLGIPSDRDMHTLSKRVDALHESVDELVKAKKPATPTRRRTKRTAAAA